MAAIMAQLPPIEDVLLWLSENDLPFNTWFDWRRLLTVRLLKMEEGTDYLVSILDGGAPMLAVVLGYVLGRMENAK